MSSRAKKSRISFLISPKNLSKTKIIKQLRNVDLSFPIHPFLFAVFPILFFVSFNKGQISLLNNEVVTTILIILIATFLTWGLLSIILKSKEKSGLITSLLLILFFSYGHVHSSIGDNNVFFTFGKDKVLFVLWVTISIIGSYFIVKTPIKLNKFSNFVSIVAVSLVVFSLVNITTFEIKTRESINSEISQNSSANQTDLKKQDRLPDIYYVIFDAFPSSNTLKEVYDYDNSELTDSLTKKGFFVASKSRTNYAHTHFSLPSSLNMEYINYLSEKLGEDSKDTSVPKSMIENNKVMRSLKSIGYKFIQIGSEYAPTSFNRYADININSSESSIKIAGFSYRLTEFSRILLQTTILSPFIKNFIGDDVKAQRLNSLNKVSEITYLKGPKFVFAHLTISHPPPLFDKEGNPLPESKIEKLGDPYSDQDNNLNQIIFVSKKMVEMAENILSKSDSPPIIIFQSDHGPTSLLGHPNNWKRPFDKNIEGVKERMEILNAYYLPYGGDKLLYDSITPVNTFRLIFDYYFGTNYGLLPDKNYYSDQVKRYQFFDVTNKLK